MKIALIVGVNHYAHGGDLHGCVNDAYNVKSMLERNDGGSVNFQCKLITVSNEHEIISRGDLRDTIEELFNRKAETALFYFAGHGHVEATGGYILSPDSKRGNEGIPLSEILVMANNSPATNRILILDSCHSGIAGDNPMLQDIASIKEGVTILTASTKDQYASEENGSGIFTSLLVDALSGSAANLVGEVTPGSVYAHIDQSLGGWEQRPVFKTNVSTFVSLRNVQPAISLVELQLIFKYFPTAGYEFQLDPTYEPEMLGRVEGLPAPIEAHTTIFATLQKFNRLNLLVPNGAPHMWHAAMESKSCKLTALGEHYRRLVEKGRI